MTSFEHNLSDKDDANILSDSPGDHRGRSVMSTTALCFGCSVFARHEARMLRGRVWRVHGDGVKV